MMTRRATTVVLVGVLMFLDLSLSGFGNDDHSSAMDVRTSWPSSHRKLLLHEKAVVEPDRIPGDKCTKADIVINQGPMGPLASGIPAYSVEIVNVCVSGCNISRVHISCGWFSSDNLISPKVFKRLAFGDCLVNDGEPIVNGGAVFFQYSNTYPYPLAVSSVFC